MRIVCAMNEAPNCRPDQSGPNGPIRVLSEKRVVVHIGSGINFVLDSSRVWITSASVANIPAVNERCGEAPTSLNRARLIYRLHLPEHVCRPINIST